MTKSGPILIAYDGSEVAKHAIAEAGLLFPGRAAVVISIWQSLESAAPATLLAIPIGVARDAYAELDKEAEHQAAAVAEQGAALAQEAGMEVTGRSEVSQQNTWCTITNIAEDMQAAAVVVGSRGRTGLKSAVLGSVSSGVASHCSRPVLVVRAEH